jgi:hypothetical protein
MRFRPRFESLEARENPSSYMMPEVPLPDPVLPEPPYDPTPPPPEPSLPVPPWPPGIPLPDPIPPS